MHVSSITGLLLAVAGLASAQWRPNVQPDNRTLDQIYQAAKREEGPLTVLWGGDARVQATSTLEGFRARFPGIDVNLTVDLSKYHDSNVDRSFYQRAEYADVALLQTLHDFPRWKSQNRLLYYKAANYSLIDDGEKDLDGAYYPMFAFSFGTWAYDSTALRERDLPRTYADLLDPRWKGKLVLTYPNDDDAINYLFSVIVAKYGWDWFNALAHQDVKWVRGTATPAFTVDPAQRNASDAGRVLTFTTIPTGTSDKVKVAPVADQFMSWFQRGAIFASTKRPETAKLWMSYMLSDDFQRPIARAGSPTQYAYLNNATGQDFHRKEFTQVDGFERFMLDRATVELWRLQFELTLGTASGPNPNTIYTKPNQLNSTAY